MLLVIQFPFIDGKRNDIPIHLQLQYLLHFRISATKHNSCPKNVVNSKPVVRTLRGSSSVSNRTLNLLTHKMLLQLTIKVGKDQNLPGAPSSHDINPRVQFVDRTNGHYAVVKDLLNKLTCANINKINRM